MIPRKLYTTYHKELIKQHLCSLESKDRYLRFAAAVNDEYINNYVENNWSDDWYGIVELDRVVAVVHVAIREKQGELGLSVDANYRGRKLGQALFQRAIVALKAYSVQDVYMVCLSENAVIKHIARKNNMLMESSRGETDADLHLPPSTPIDAVTDVVVEQLALYDSAVRNTNLLWKKMYETI